MDLVFQKKQSHVLPQFLTIRKSDYSFVHEELTTTSGPTVYPSTDMNHFADLKWLGLY